MKLTKLDKAICKQLDIDRKYNYAEWREILTDINTGGIEGGFPGFTYYSDTVEFFNANRKQILKGLRTMIWFRGTDIIETVRNMLEAYRVDAVHNYQMFDVIAGIEKDHGDTEGMSHGYAVIKNVLVWTMVQDRAFFMLENDLNR